MGGRWWVTLGCPQVLKTSDCRTLWTRGLPSVPQISPLDPVPLLFHFLKHFGDVIHACVHVTDVRQHWLKARSYGRCWRCRKIRESQLLGRSWVSDGVREDPSGRDQSPLSPGTCGSCRKLLWSPTNQIWRSAHMQEEEPGLSFSVLRPGFVHPTIAS